MPVVCFMCVFLIFCTLCTIYIINKIIIVNSSITLLARTV